MLGARLLRAGPSLGDIVMLLVATTMLEDEELNT
jgi:hypothetical protein